MAKCRVCGKTELEVEFYKSNISFCKEHWKERVQLNRASNSDYYKEFDRNRASSPDRIELRKAYQKTEAYKASHAAACLRYKERHKQKRSAAGAVNHALAKGLISKAAYFVCGSEESEAHHPNYDAPLDVIWLCDADHKAAHVLGRKIIRQEESKRIDESTERKAA